MANPVLVEVTRGAHVECRHRGAIVVADAKGGIRASLGDTGLAVFPRSAVKAIQALPLVESGAADAYGLSEAELALACASHGGEARHVATAAAMLHKAGRSAPDLECGVHMPSNEAAARALIRSGDEPGPLHNNCSGKHAGFICLACRMGAEPAGYVGPEHPVQRAVTAALADVTGTTLDARNRAIDGCSIPTYAIPLAGLARGFARLVTGEGLAADRAAAARRLVAACMAEPFMVAGTGRFCTEAMELFRGRLFVKTGAEGVFCAAFPALGLGVALKCEDGATRASETAMAAVIEAFLPMSDAERAAFAARLTPAILTRRGVRVGEVRPVAGLVDRLRSGERL
jgi:L-asparaginase II